MKNESYSKSVESPCIRHCTLNEDDICVGCYRSLDEIVAWGTSTAAEKSAILDVSRLRRNDQRDQKDQKNQNKTND